MHQIEFFHEFTSAAVVTAADKSEDKNDFNDYANIVLRIM